MVLEDIKDPGRLDLVASNLNLVEEAQIILETLAQLKN